MEKFAQKRLVSVVSALLAVIVVFGMIPQNLVAATTKSFTYSTFTSNGPAVINEINRDRTSGGGFYVDSNNVNHYVGKLDALKSEGNMFAIASQRSVEIAAYFSNTRPDGTSFTTCTSNGIHATNEYIYVSDRELSRTDLYAVWFAVGRGPAAYAMMNSLIKSYGLAYVQVDGKYYYVLELSTAYKDPMPNQWGTKDYTINYSTSVVGETYTFTPSDSNWTYITGYMSAAPSGTLRQFVGNLRTGRVYYTSNLTVNWTFSKSGYVEIVNKEFFFKKIGTFNATGSFVIDGKVVGTYTFPITVQAAAANQIDLCTDSTGLVYTGNPQKPRIYVNGDATHHYYLTEGVDYTVTNTINGTEAANSYITIQGTGTMFTGTKTLRYEIAPRPLSECTITFQRTYVANSGHMVIVEPEVRYGNRVLQPGNDYTVTRDAGMQSPVSNGTLTINGRGNFSGSVNLNYSIVTPTPRPTNTPTPRPTNTPTPRPTNTPTPRPTNTPRPTATNTPRPTATNTPRPTATNTPRPTATNTPRPTATNTPVPEVTLPAFGHNFYGYGVDGFVNRMYRVVMNRSVPLDPNGGKVYWVNELLSQRRNGGEVAKVFLTSAEFTSKGYNNEQFVEILYRLFFNRSLGTNIRTNYWVEQLNTGKMTRQKVIDNFINSKEWANICFTFGIVPGGSNKPDANLPPADGIVEFVGLFYDIINPNEPISENVQRYWATEMSNRRMTARDMAYSLIFSENSPCRGYTDSQFVYILYAATTNQEITPDLLDYWVGQVRSTSRGAVFNRMINTREWATICYYFGAPSGISIAPDVTLDCVGLNKIPEDAVPSICYGMVTLNNMSYDSGVDADIPEDIVIDVEEAAEEEVIPEEPSIEEETEEPIIEETSIDIEEAEFDEVILEQEEAEDLVET